MSTITQRGRLCAAALTVLAAAAVPQAVEAAPVTLTPPVIRGVAPLPGPIAPSASPAENMGILRASPDKVKLGQSFTLTGSGLPAGKEVTLTWSTANATWMVDARPDSVDYLGRKLDRFAVVLTTTRTTAGGSFSVTLPVPRDFGGLHDVYAVIDGKQVAKGGLLIERSVTMRPKRGPIGTMITIEYSGIGPSLYEHSNAITYDNKYTGTMLTTWTRGVSTVKIRAAGPVGRRIIEVGGATPFIYRNIPQSPLPYVNGYKLVFTVTEDAGRPPLRVDRPAKVAPTLDARTTLREAGLDPASTAKATLSESAGAVGSKLDVTASGLLPNTDVSIEWSTVVGNRVNCTTNCWNFVSFPIKSARAGADGSLRAPVEIPDGLGGWHVIQLFQNGRVQAQVPYFVERSLVGKGLSRLVLEEGQRFTVHLKGVGWTQLDNTVAVTYDNSYVGYGCGFNSNGDVVLNLVATGGKGTHLIDIWPLMYTINPVYTTAFNGMVPMLSYANDLPGLALGYELPVIRLAITIK